MLINRNLYLQRLVSRMHNGMVKVITGIRRSGKSFLLFEIFRQYLLDHGVSADHILGLQLDRFENRRYRDPEELLAFMNAQIVDDGRYYILLDEVQMLDHFSEVLNSFLYRNGYISIWNRGIRGCSPNKRHFALQSAYLAKDSMLGNPTRHKIRLNAR